MIIARLDDSSPRTSHKHGASTGFTSGIAAEGRRGGGKGQGNPRSRRVSKTDASAGFSATEPDKKVTAWNSPSANPLAEVASERHAADVTASRRWLGGRRGEGR